MSKGTVNKVIILGRLGADPEVRYMPSGGAVANLRVATNDGYKDKQTNQFVETTEWHRIVLFGRLAEIAGEYLRKGSNVFVEGRLRTNKWKDQAGQDRYTTEIVAAEMQLLGSNNGGAGARSSSGNEGGAEEFSEAPVKSTREKPKAMTGSTASAENFEQFSDDDIPF